MREEPGADNGEERGQRLPAHEIVIVIGICVLLVATVAVLIGRDLAAGPEPGRSPVATRLPPGPSEVPESRRPGSPRPSVTTRPPSSRPATPERPVTVDWRITPEKLRPELPEPEFIGPVDGDHSGPYLSAVDPKIADVWVAMTGTDDEEKMIIHGIDPKSGRVRWNRPMEGALCASEAHPAGLVCAELRERDRTTKLGRRWRLQLLDPHNGETRRSRTVDGWFSALHRAGDTLIVLEQREPAPHAVLRGYDLATLRPRWELDLKGEPGHDKLFSEDRIIARKDPDREGVVMDRPRFRDVGYDHGQEQTGDGGLVALWAGQRTAFVEPGSGRLIMMPHCSRLVDDGRRLWCNEPDGAASYSYGGRLLRRVEGPRLAFPGDDGIGVDRNRPVFTDDDGHPVSVDLATGKVGRPYRMPGAGSRSKKTLVPRTETVGGHTLLITESGTMLIHPRQDKISWLNPDITNTDLPILIKDELLLDYSYAESAFVDVRTGKPKGTAALRGRFAVQIGNRIAGVGTDEICLLRIG